MSITLTIEKAPPGGEPVGTSRSFEGQSVTLGRGQRNDWVLPDDGAFLSRNHCEIVCEGNTYAVVDTSKSGLFVNGASAPLGTGNRAALRDGDILSLGGEYELRVHLDSTETRVAPPIPMPQPELDVPFGMRDEPIGPIPDFPFGDSPFPPPVRPDAGASGYDDPGLPMRDDAAVEHAAIGPLRVGVPLIPDDWDREPRQQSVRSPSLPPIPPPVMPQAAPQAVPQSGPQSGPQTETAFGAFVGGAGLKGRALSDVDPISRLKEAGKTYRAAVDGILEILRAREQFKEALRIERTQINASGNNPLKFCPDTEQALLTMIGGDRPGYMLARDAMREALKDIKAHEMALVAAIQVALTRLLAQIDPEALKQRLEKSWLDGLVPGARKARTWKLYEAMHAELAQELADDFDRAFGKAFAEAYEEYLRTK